MKSHIKPKRLKMAKKRAATGSAGVNPIAFRKMMTRRFRLG